MTRDIPEISLQRLPIYLNYLKSLPEGDKYISSGAIAAALGMGEVLVRTGLLFKSGEGLRIRRSVPLSLLRKRCCKAQEAL